MSVVVITEILNIRGGNGTNGLLKKVFSTDSSAITRWKFIGANGKLATGIVGSKNEADFFVYEAGLFGSASANDAMAVTSDLMAYLDNAYTVGTKLYLNNTTAGTAGGIVTDITATTGDLLQEVGIVTADGTGNSTSKLAFIRIKPAKTV